MARTLIKQHKDIKNYLINASFDIAQRSVTSHVNGQQGYVTDRWFGWTDTGITQSYNRIFFGGESWQDSFGQIKKVKCQTGMRLTKTAGGATVPGVSNRAIFGQNLETVMARELFGQKVTVGFKVRKQSGLTGTITLISKVQTGQEARLGGGIATSLDINASQLDTVYFKEFYVTLDASSLASSAILGAAIEIYINQAGGANVGIDICEPYLIAGEGPFDWKTHCEDFAGEVAACQRFYELCRFGFRNDYGNNGAATVETTHLYATTKRATPTITLFNVTTANVASGPTIADPRANSVQLAWTATGSSPPLAHWAFADVHVDAEI